MVRILHLLEWQPMVVYTLGRQEVIVTTTHLIHWPDSITYTLYPFWTDLIRDNGSKVLAKNFTDKVCIWLVQPKRIQPQWQYRQFV